MDQFIHILNIGNIYEFNKHQKSGILLFLLNVRFLAIFFWIIFIGHNNNKIVIV